MGTGGDGRRLLLGPGDKRNRAGVCRLWGVLRRIDEGLSKTGIMANAVVFLALKQPYKKHVTLISYMVLLFYCKFSFDIENSGYCQA